MDQNNPFRNRDQDSLVAAVRAVLSGKPNEAQEKVEQELEKAEAMDPVNPQAVKKKFKDRKDKDIDNDGDVDGSDEYLHKRRKAISKAVKEAVEDNPANRQHLCAKNVVHENWGEGVCIPTMHADPNVEGDVEWYDVMFEHGIETRVSIDELKVTKAESHTHGGKKKKMSEADDMEDDDDDDDDDDDEEENGKKKKMNGKKDEVDTEPSIDDKKDTAEAKEMTDAQMKRREEIVKGMKDKMGDFKKRYGDRAKDVMYATATKMALKEAQKPYVSSDSDGKHVMNAAGKIDRTFKDMESASNYLRKHYKRLASVREEVELDENNLEKMRKASKGSAQTLKMKDGNLKMDSFTASAIMQIYDKINDKNKKTFENMMKNGKKADILKLQKFAMSKINSEYVPEEVELTEMEGQPAQKDKDGKFIKKPGYLIKLAPGKGYIYRRETGPVTPGSIGRDGGMSGRPHGPGITGVRR